MVNVADVVKSLQGAFSNKLALVLYLDGESIVPTVYWEVLVQQGLETQRSDALSL